MLDRLGFDQRGARPHQARQSQAIRTWRPWTRSTGPRSDAGNKSRSANRRDDLAVTRDSGRCWLSADGACRRQSTSRAPVKHQGKQQGKQHHVSPGEGWCWRIKAHLPSSVRGHVLPERPFPVKIDGARAASSFSWSCAHHTPEPPLELIPLLGTCVAVPQLRRRPGDFGDRPKRGRSVGELVLLSI